MPRPVRSQISLAYLLARTSDTIADTALVPVEQRVMALESFRASLLDLTKPVPSLDHLITGQGAPAEQALLEHVPALFARLAGCPEPDRGLIRQVLDIITSGQILDLRRFGQANAAGRASSPKAPGVIPAEGITALVEEAELDDYTWRVAGCVGEFWTRTCRHHLFPRATLDDSWLIAQGIRFGKGLQLVNILRDLPRDLRQGRCYLPMNQLVPLNLLPEHLLDPANESRMRPLYNRYLNLARDHLKAGWDYTCALPRRQVRVRLACAWPILLGIKTLALLRAIPILDPSLHVKVGRKEVRTIVVRTILRYPTVQGWQRLFEEEVRLMGQQIMDKTVA